MVDTPQRPEPTVAPEPPPMISVEGLTKHYGAVLAIDGVCFSVAQGEVVGFLGPNGAGKTTTMRILCGSLGATAGTASVGGVDVQAHPIQVKARIGYLPESPPLYKGMGVRNYLRFAAAIKGTKAPVEAIERVLEQVGLLEKVGGMPAADRIIGHLSKGFQQRVGLAQALIHDPDVLILDEPTSGLDPAQRKEIRDLLLALARESRRTVILSTHVLADVEAICGRVVIIDQGTIVAQDSIESLRGQAGRVRVVLKRPSLEAVAELQALDGVHGVETGTDGGYMLSVSGDCRTQIADVAVPHGLLELREDQSLEEIYLRLTGGDR